MAYFDLTRAEIADRGRAAVLGYKKILSGKELPVVENLSLSSQCVVRSGETGMLGRAVRRSNVAGIIIKDNELLRLAVEETVENEKLLFLPLHEILCSDTRSRMRNIYRMRGLMAFATRSRAKISLVTLAEGEPCILSTMQMLEIAKFLGANESNSKKMISTLGDIQ
jgi:RNase P/RNase MRP subunit p30